MKKLLSTAIIATSILSITQSAFASEVPETEITPYVVGLGDTREKALTLISGQEYSLYLENSTEQDWFKWTNNTGEGKFILGNAFNGGNNNSVVLGAQIVYNESRESTVLYADPAPVDNKGLPSIIRNLYVPDEATLYLTVKADYFSKLEQYKLFFNVYNL